MSLTRLAPVGMLLTALTLTTAAPAGAAAQTAQPSGHRHGQKIARHVGNKTADHRARTAAERRRARAARRAGARARHRTPAPAAPARPVAPAAPSAPVARPTTPAASAPAPAPAPVAPAASQTCTDTTTVPDASNVATIRAAVLCLVNQQRAANGLVALTDNAQLDLAAQRHSDDMVARGFFDHTTPDGVTFDARIRTAATGTTFNRMAENIAWGSGSLATPARIVENWMNSAGHRANILDGALRESGIGVAIGAPMSVSGSAATYTQDFAAR